MTEWMPLVLDIFEFCIVPLLGVLTVYLVNFIKGKSEDLKAKIDNDIADKYITMLNDTVTACVVATTQTYVENLKKQNLFDEAAQKMAFEKTFNAIMEILTDDAKEYLSAIYGDLSMYIATKIEAEVKLNK